MPSPAFRRQHLAFSRVFLLGALLATAPALAASPDAYLTARAKLALWTTAGLRSATVHVDTFDGTITLHGSVATQAQRTLAGKVAAEGVEVKAVNNLLQVVPTQDAKAVARSDQELKAAAEKALRADPQLVDSSLWVKSVDNGVVLLVGEAHTYADQLRAIADVDQVPGVQRIASEVKSPRDFREDERITFVSPRAALRDGKANLEGRAAAAQRGASDTRISAEVKLRLLTAPLIPSSEISVDTDLGVVTLFGLVPTAEVKKAAGAEAAKVEGLRRVDNQLEVVSSAAKQAVDARDGDITRDLALTFQDRFEQRHVTVQVKNGTVRLTGTVRSGFDQLLAVRLARAVPGVHGVENQLTLE